MAVSSRLAFCFVWLLLVLPIIEAASPFSTFKWSDRTYGPDGPWYAVTVELGSKRQPIDLYPGDRWASTILLDNACDNKTISDVCYAERAGMFNSNRSTSNAPGFENLWVTSENFDTNKGTKLHRVMGDSVVIGATEPTRNISFDAVSEAYTTYPNGKNYPVFVGTLALGAPRRYHIVEGWRFNMVAAYLYHLTAGEAQLPSYSYGMHIGSVALDIPPSLILGGYDRNRVLGNVSRQPVAQDSGGTGALRIKMTDITIGIAGGESPFEESSYDKLLQRDGDSDPQSSQALEADLEPVKPYLYLPKTTCDNIAARLPVTFDAGLGLYFWDTKDPQYDRIVSSAAYLGFQFYGNNSNTKKLEVKVPFSLLSLTLQEPLVEKNTSYFPCFPTDSEPVILGRAFLQAAFIASNWHDDTGTGEWYLAQGPGPAVASTPEVTVIEPDDSTLAASSDTWESSWADHWGLDPNDTGVDDLGDARESSAEGLSTGAKVGVGVGVGVGGLLLIGAVAAAWWLLRRRRQREQAQALAAQDASAGGRPPLSSNSKPLRELAGEGLPHEMHNSTIYEAPAPHSDTGKSKQSERFELA